jgi:hypothetical protein
MVPQAFHYSKKPGKMSIAEYNDNEGMSKSPVSLTLDGGCVMLNWIIDKLEMLWL